MYVYVYQMSVNKNTIYIKLPVIETEDHVSTFSERLKREENILISLLRNNNVFHYFIRI